MKESETEEENKDRTGIEEDTKEIKDHISCAKRRERERERERARELESVF